MNVCYICKIENDNLYEVKSLTDIKRKEYFCSDCCDTDIEKCKCCDVENYGCYMYRYDDDDSSSYYDRDEDGPFYFCSAGCLNNEIDSVYTYCKCCDKIIDNYTNYKDNLDNYYCSSHCINKYDLLYCMPCNKYYPKNKLFLYDKINNSDYYKCFNHGKCKTCKTVLLPTDNENILGFYFKGFCSEKCSNNLGNSNYLTKENMVDFFYDNDTKFFNNIKKNNNTNKIEINKYGNLFRVYDYFDKKFGWRQAHTKSEFLYKEINGIIFVIGRGFVYAFNDKPIYGRKGWLYNYVDGIDLSVVRELSKSIEDFEYALYFFEGRINKFN